MITPKDPGLDSGQDDLLARVALMEALIEQGRECTRRWGEFGVLWGSGSLIAFIWSQFTGDWHSWMWLDVVAYPLTLLLLVRRWRMHRSVTPTMRFVNSLWLVTGLSTSVAGFAGGLSGEMSYRAIGEIAFLFFGTANLVSGFAFRWPLQITVGISFWISGVALLFASGWLYFWVYCSAIFFGELCFGVYLMITEFENQFA